MLTERPVVVCARILDLLSTLQLFRSRRTYDNPNSKRVCDEGRKRGPNLNKVTIALEQYWDSQAGVGRTIQAQMECYSMLINACKTWIKRKDTKSDFKKGLLDQSTNYINLKFTGRRTEISKIG